MPSSVEYFVEEETPEWDTHTHVAAAKVQAIQRGRMSRVETANRNSATKGAGAEEEEEIETNPVSDFIEGFKQQSTQLLAGVSSLFSQSASPSPAPPQQKRKKKNKAVAGTPANPTLRASGYLADESPSLEA